MTRTEISPDVIRVLAIVMVVIIHIVGPGLLEAQQVSKSDFFVGCFFNSVSRPSVPLFTMVSGYFILNKEYNILDFFKSRTLKVLLPFLVWSVIYAILHIMIEKSGYKFITNFLKLTLIGPAHYHLWYIYVLLSLYCVAPFLRKIVVNLSNVQIIFFLIFWFVATFVIPKIEFIVKQKILFQLPFFTDFIGYFALGYFIGRKQALIFILPVSIKKREILLVILYLISLFYTFIFTFFSDKYHYVKLDDKRVESYLSINVMLMSIILFYWFIRKDYSNALFIKWINKLASASYGIYLVHPFIINLLEKVNFTATSSLFIISTPILTMLTIIGSFAFVHSIKQTKFGSYFVG